MQVIRRLVPAKADKIHIQEAEECLDLMLLHLSEAFTQETRPSGATVIKASLSADINALHMKLRELE